MSDPALFGSEQAQAFDLGDHTVEWDDAARSWSLYWRHGSMRPRWFRAEDRENAEKVARLFGFLYSKGVPCDLARDVASDHVYVESKWYREIQEKAEPRIWRPIESAPKDGTPILVYGSSRWDQHDRPRHGVSIAYWSAIDLRGEVGTGPDSAYWRLVDANPGSDRATPSHWMAIPPPPEDATSPAT